MSTKEYSWGNCDDRTAERLRKARAIVAQQRRGAWRARMFRDLVLTELQERDNASRVLLDIGCGRGFDDSPNLQREIAKHANHVIGVEPDVSMARPPSINELHQATLEESPISPDSIDVAYSVMVLEHVEDPEKFWAAVRRVLRTGGVFWGFTMDSRHWFASASRMASFLGMKSWYLGRLAGSPGTDRYTNYPTMYRTNTPSQLRAWTSHFCHTAAWSIGWPGQLDFYFPKPLRPVIASLDRLAAAVSYPGSILAVRVQK